MSNTPTWAKKIFHKVEGSSKKCSFIGISSAWEIMSWSGKVSKFLPFDRVRIFFCVAHVREVAFSDNSLMDFLGWWSGTLGRYQDLLVWYCKYIHVSNRVPWSVSQFGCKWIRTPSRNAQIEVERLCCPWLDEVTPIYIFSIYGLQTVSLVNKILLICVEM